MLEEVLVLVRVDVLVLDDVLELVLVDVLVLDDVLELVIVDVLVLDEVLELVDELVFVICARRRAGRGFRRCASTRGSTCAGFRRRTFHHKKRVLDYRYYRFFVYLIVNGLT